jgi:hypothetical protein
MIAHLKLAHSINEGEDMKQKTTQELSIRDAAYYTVHEYAPGTVALAARMNLNQQTLCHKVNPNNTNRNNLTLEEAVTLQLMTEDHRILFSMACLLGYFCVIQGGAAEGNVTTDIAQTMQDLGDMLKTVSASIADGRVTDRELREVDHAVLQLMGDLNHLRGRLADMNELTRSTKPLTLHEQVQNKARA